MKTERIMVTRWEDAPENHRRRYEWAARKRAEDYGSLLHHYGALLDYGCGCGYGAAYLYDAAPEWDVYAVDTSDEAIAWARQHFRRTHWLPWFETVDEYDAGWKSAYHVVTCFEVLEHLDDPARVLDIFRGDAWDETSTLLLSVPNERYAPCTPIDYPFHKRHYTPETLEALLNRCGWTVTQWACQRGSEPGACDVIDGSPDGLAILAVCEPR